MQAYGCLAHAMKLSSSCSIKRTVPYTMGTPLLRNILATSLMNDGRSRPRDVDLGDHLRRALFRAELRVQPQVIVVEIRAHLVRIRPVDLPRRGQVVLRIPVERRRLCRCAPAAAAHASLRPPAPAARPASASPERRPVAGEHAAAQRSRPTSRRRKTGSRRT